MKSYDERLVRRAIALSWFTIIYNLIEGLISIWFGMSDDSISLFGFGADSFIEVFSAVLVLWRFRWETGKSEELSIARERRATLGIGIFFSLLAIGTTVGSVIQLLRGAHPQTTLPSFLVSIVSLSFMFFLWKSKKKIGIALGSATVAKDADCSLACIKLSLILFLGSFLFLIAPSLWWADAVAGIALSGLIAKEGFDTVRASQRKDFSGGCCC